MGSGGWRIDRRVRASLRSRLSRAVRDAVTERLQTSEAEQAAALASLGTSIAGLVHGLELISEDLARLDARTNEIRNITARGFDRVPELRSQLLRAREHPDYAASFNEREPLVSVRIATHDRADILFDRAVPSVLAQTYPRLELIIVGDRCSEATVRRAATCTDPRVRFVHLPSRECYPSDAQPRWQIAGAAAMNHGAELATGEWIAPLDDDDEFAPDHVETLVTAAQRDGYEMVYGRMRMVPPAPHPEYELGAYPPEAGHFGFQAALYMRSLGFFEYDTASWVLDEPADWNLCRRMMAAGVRIGHVPRVVTTVRTDHPGVEPSAATV